MSFPVDALAAVSPEELDLSAEEYVTHLLQSDPDRPEQLVLADSSQASLSLPRVGYVPLYGDSDHHKLLALFGPDSCTAIALHLRDRWWLPEDVLHTDAPARHGAVQVETVAERIVLYVLNRVVYRGGERDAGETPFLCHGEHHTAKILWVDGEAVGFYSVKPAGSVCSSSPDQHYQLPVMDSLFVRKRFRRRGFSLRMLEDFVACHRDDRLGLRYPLPRAMYRVCERYFSRHPDATDLLWEVQHVGGLEQRTNIARKIQSMGLNACSKNLSFTEESFVIGDKLTEESVMEEITTRTKQHPSVEYTEIAEDSVGKHNTEADGVPVRGEANQSDVIRVEDIEAGPPTEQLAEHHQEDMVMVEQAEDTVAMATDLAPAAVPTMVTSQDLDGHATPTLPRRLPAAPVENVSLEAEQRQQHLGKAVVVPEEVGGTYGHFEARDGVREESYTVEEWRVKRCVKCKAVTLQPSAGRQQPTVTVEGSASAASETSMRELHTESFSAEGQQGEMRTEGNMEDEVPRPSAESERLVSEVTSVEELGDAGEAEEVAVVQTRALRSGKKAVKATHRCKTSRKAGTLQQVEKVAVESPGKVKGTTQPSQQKGDGESAVVKQRDVQIAKVWTETAVVREEQKITLLVGEGLERDLANQKEMEVDGAPDQVEEGIEPCEELAAATTQEEDMLMEDVSVTPAHETVETLELATPQPPPPPEASVLLHDEPAVAASSLQRATVILVDLKSGTPQLRVKEDSGKGVQSPEPKAEEDGVGPAVEERCVTLHLDIEEAEGTENETVAETVEVVETGAADHAVITKVVRATGAVAEGPVVETRALRSVRKSVKEAHSRKSTRKGKPPREDEPEAEEAARAMSADDREEAIEVQADVSTQREFSEESAAGTEAEVVTPEDVPALVGVEEKDKMEAETALEAAAGTRDAQGHSAREADTAAPPGDAEPEKAEAPLVPGESASEQASANEAKRSDTEEQTPPVVETRNLRSGLKTVIASPGHKARRGKKQRELEEEEEEANTSLGTSAEDEETPADKRLPRRGRRSFPARQKTKKARKEVQNEGEAQDASMSQDETELAAPQEEEVKEMASGEAEEPDEEMAGEAPEEKLEGAAMGSEETQQTSVEEMSFAEEDKRESSDEEPPVVPSRRRIPLQSTPKASKRRSKTTRRTSPRQHTGEEEGTGARAEEDIIVPGGEEVTGREPREQVAADGESSGEETADVVMEILDDWTPEGVEGTSGVGEAAVEGRAEEPTGPAGASERSGDAGAAAEGGSARKRSRRPRDEEAGAPTRRSTRQKPRVDYRENDADGQTAEDEVVTSGSPDEVRASDAPEKEAELEEDELRASDAPEKEAELEEDELRASDAPEKEAELEEDELRASDAPEKEAELEEDELRASAAPEKEAEEDELRASVAPEKDEEEDVHLVVDSDDEKEESGAEEEESKASMVISPKQLRSREIPSITISPRSRCSSPRSQGNREAREHEEESEEGTPPSAGKGSVRKRKTAGTPPHRAKRPHRK